MNSYQVKNREGKHIIVSPQVHSKIKMIAALQGKTLNQWIGEIVDEYEIPTLTKK